MLDMHANYMKKGLECLAACELLSQPANRIHWLLAIIVQGIGRVKDCVYEVAVAFVPRNAWQEYLKLTALQK